ncbi:hypothetical protein ASE69_06550 [Sphingomonas sp. Leaf208]|jgi:hypothetical protein|uniref:hypothetical protein n=1 Tax=Sphingomonas sp. Leaf208 TaxID=1735679 RepID=UPI0003923759|nr:hypothetical protein [Sphingomonas sp. Leaf208]AGU11556.1 hypothetical protein [uncultured organism]KQM51013.1 hypothetical protein ASE69_06550 [Sphingomonas sp. Leaf208]RYD29265.1 MAG: hypothetical protein EOP89_00365 [Xanthomonadaceae bacterium]
MMKRIAISLATIVIATSSVFAQQPEPSAPAKAVAKPERPICKRSAPSGSLVETRRECHTRAEWNRLAQEGRAAGQDVVDRAAMGGQ